MIIQEIKEGLLQSEHPVARILYKHEKFRILAIGFLTGMILKDHKTPYHSRLVVLEGEVAYHEGDETYYLQQYAEQDIPPLVTHHVKAMEDSMCLLIQHEAGNK